MLKYNLYISDIERAMVNIGNSIKGMSIESFSKNQDAIDSNSMRMQIIGESLKKIPLNLWGDYKNEIKSLIDFRNVISHAYFKINPLLLWDVLQNKIPQLKTELKKILKYTKE